MEIGEKEPDLQAVIIVVDSSDIKDVEKAKGKIQKENLQKLPILVLANKQDIEGALSSKDIENKLQLSEIKDFPWHVQPTSALNGEGIEEGFKWLAGVVKPSNMSNASQSERKN